MLPKQPKQILWVFILVQKAKLVQIRVFQQGLTRVNLSLIILPIHENLQELNSGVETKHRTEVTVLVAVIGVNLLCGHFEF